MHMHSVVIYVVIFIANSLHGSMKYVLTINDLYQYFFIKKVGIDYTNYLTKYIFDHNCETTCSLYMGNNSNRR